MRRPQLQRSDSHRRLWGLVQERRRCTWSTRRVIAQDTDSPVFQAIRSGDRSRLIVTPEQAALTIEVVEAAVRSSAEGKTIAL